MSFPIVSHSVISFSLFPAPLASRAARVILIALLWLISLPTLKAQDAAIPTRPDPPKLFNDFVGLVDTPAAQRIEQYLVSMDDSTTVQIAVVIVKTTEPYEINDYTQRLAQSWGVGQKDKNNGIVFLIAADDHKSAIQVGYGLEGAVTDLETSQIQDNVMRPLMRANEVEKAILSVSEALYKAAKEDYTAQAPKKQKKGKGIPTWIIVIGVIIFLAFISRGGGKNGGRRRYRNGGGFMPPIFFGGGGGGGSWGNFSGGSGGFGGFGGGSFGGGGSSGSW